MWIFLKITEYEVGYGYEFIASEDLNETQNYLLSSNYELISVVDNRDRDQFEAVCKCFMKKFCGDDFYEIS